MRLVAIYLSLIIVFISCRQQNKHDEEAVAMPNILIIQPDQHRGDVLSCAGHPDVQTPNLDQLAREGIRFSNAISGTPVCCPFRATFQTGLYIHEHGVVRNNLLLDPEFTTIAELMVNAGYVTGYIGKWHLDGGIPEDEPGGYVEEGPRRQGWQEWQGYEKAHEYFDVWKYNEKRQKVRVEGYDWEPTWHTEVAIEFIERHTQNNQPWCYYIAYGPPHNPEQCPEEYLDLYDPDQLTLPPDVMNNLDDETSSAVRALLQIYYGQVTAVDDEVGRLMRRLKELNVEDNTIVFYVSDHGDVLGSHSNDIRKKYQRENDARTNIIRTKGKPYMTAMRIPLIIRWPAAIAPDRVNENLINSIDLAPTLLDLAGLDVPAVMSGTSMAGWCISGDGPVKESLYLGLWGTNDKNAWRAVFDGRYTYSNLDFKLMYDHQKDPFEMKNLFGDPEYAEVQKDMEAKLLKLVQSAGDPIFPRLKGEIMGRKQRP